MLPIPQEILKRLRLAEAVDEECKSWQSLVPPVPGFEWVASNKDAYVRWLGGQLRAGVPIAPEVIISTRKVPLGVRPVAVWGLTERVLYRALVAFLLRNEPALDRSPEAYLRFIGGPLQYARELEPDPEPLRIAGFAFTSPHVPVSSSLIHYVVKADINAFYEYVDHSVLSRELLTRTGDHAAIECLMSLLAEAQGRSFGLPQLMEPSDRLSELYADIVERDLLRRGWPAWRFNDDFRIAVRDFGAALSAIEDLAAAAREVGLTLSDLKTTTPRFSKYAWENFGLSVDDELPAELSRHNAADMVGDYTEGVGETDLTWAIQQIGDAYTPETPDAERSESGIDLANVRGSDFRILRRALGRLIRSRAEDGFPHLVKLVAYVPSLTPWVIRYAIAAGEQHREDAANLFATLVADVAMSDWQRMWVVRGLTDLELLDPAVSHSASEMAGWVEALRHGRHSPVVRAEASLALAAAGRIDFRDLEHSLRGQPAALSAWYLVAIRRLHARGGGVSDDQVAAIRGEGGLFASILAAS